uniref:C2H2-type domain-containing protein n=1 Tax=Meloidogyne floridensis TaxID=298350 RepID=A0A915P8C3_9BILA
CRHCLKRFSHSGSYSSHMSSKKCQQQQQKLAAASVIVNSDKQINNQQNSSFSSSTASSSSSSSPNNSSSIFGNKQQTISSSNIFNNNNYLLEQLRLYYTQQQQLIKQQNGNSPSNLFSSSIDSLPNNFWNPQQPPLFPFQFSAALAAASCLPLNYNNFIQPGISESINGKDQLDIKSPIKSEEECQVSTNGKQCMRIFV